MSLSVVIPSYKEADNIAKLSKTIVKNIEDCSVLVVDDSPDDSCVRAIEELNNSKIKIIHRTNKGGRGSAVLLGLKSSLPNSSDYYLEIDADFSHPPGQIPELIELMKSTKSDMVIASRYLPESKILNWPTKRKIFSSFSNKLARIMLRIPITDYTNGFRLYNGRAARKIVETCEGGSKGFIALSEILVNLHYRNFKIVETPTIFTNRMRGESSLSLKEVSGAASGILRIFFMIPRIKKDSSRFSGQTLKSAGRS